MHPRHSARFSSPASMTHNKSSPQATTRRTATARSRVRLPPEVTSKMETVGGEVVGKKGPVFTTAIIAGVQAAKRTSDLIPFCHPLPIEDCRVELSLVEGGKVRVAMLLEMKYGDDVCLHYFTRIFHWRRKTFLSTPCQVLCG